MSDASELIKQQFVDGGVVPGVLPGQNAVSKTYVDQQIAAATASLNDVINAKKIFSTIGGVSAINSTDTLTLYSSNELSIVPDPTFRTLTFSLDQSKLTSIPAQNITYSGKVTGATQVKQALDSLKDTVDSIQTGGDSNAEVTAARVSTPYGVTYTNLKNRLDAMDQRQRQEVISVADYGAKGDGTTDDYQAFANAIAAAGDKDIVYVPKPASFYRIAQKIVIGKPLTIEGNHYEVSASATTTIVFDAAVTTGFEVTFRDVKIKGLSIKMLNNTNTLVAGINLTNSTPGALSNQMLEDLFIFINGSFGSGVRGKNVITSVVDNVRCYQGAYGFYFDTAGTSIKFDTSWGMSNTKCGFYLSGYEYCDFINCACDSPNNPDYGYQIVSSNGISLVSCGAEGIGKSFAKLDTCNGVSFLSCRGVGLNHANTGVASFSEQVNSSNVTYIGCMETGQTGLLANIVATGSLYPVIMNCNFQKITMDSTTYTNGAFDRGIVRFGGLALNIAPFGGQISTVSNHDLYFNERRLGVVRSDGGAFYGYFDSDGGIVTRSIGTLPTANAANRGKLLRVEGGTNVADKLYICRKNASDAYEWAVIN